MDTTLLKGLTLLENLASGDCSRGITELSEELGWVKSNVHRVLQTLTYAGYVRKDANTGKYECTLKLWELGTLTAERLDIRGVSQPHVRDLAKKVPETVHLSILDGRDVLYVDKIDSEHPVRAYTRIGGRAPAHCVATGKALLAYASEALLREVMANLDAYTPRTITDPTQFTKELKRIRDSGIAINRGEWRESVRGIASPILVGQHHAIAAIGISGPSERLSVKRLQELGPLVVEAATKISCALVD